MSDGSKRALTTQDGTRLLTLENMGTNDFEIYMDPSPVPYGETREPPVTPAVTFVPFMDLSPDEVPIPKIPITMKLKKWEWDDTQNHAIFEYILAVRNVDITDSGGDYIYVQSGQDGNSGFNATSIEL